MANYFINCDIGEGVGNEDQLMPYIDACNIACGGHAGNLASMNEMVELAQKYNVKIGAHPSYPDVVNFGRKSIAMKSDELIDTIRKQIDSLLNIIYLCGATLTHIKAHGALYNDIAKDASIAKTYLKGIQDFREVVKLFVPYGSVVAKMAVEQGFTILYEAFADRNYKDDLSLVSRTEENAVLTDVASVLRHVDCMKVSGAVNTVNGHQIKIKADTFCVHSDTTNAVEIVRELSKVNPG